MRRVTLGLRPTASTIAIVLALPVLIGLGARWSALAEIERLRVGNSALRLENTSFRAATGELTTQIASLESAIGELTERAAIDPAAKQAIEKLPALVKARAMGGGSGSDPETRALLATALTPPTDTFGVLRDLLVNLDSRLQVVRTGVERRAALASAAPSIWPALGWITSGFGYRRDPFDGQRQMHEGLDISADRGHPVYAAADGQVASAGRNGDYGNLVAVDHGYGLVTRYAHLSAFGVQAGDHVSRGDIVGYVGATGRTTSAHLHYEVWVNGQPINPLGFLAARRPEQP